MPRRTTKRTFTANDAARIVCKAIEDGATRAEIEQLIEEKCPGVQTKINVFQKVDSFQFAIDNAEANNGDWTKMVDAISIAGTAMGALVLALQFTPLRLIGRPMTAAQAAIRNLGSTARRRREENEAFIVFMRQTMENNNRLMKQFQEQSIIIG